MRSKREEFVRRFAGSGISLASLFVLLLGAGVEPVSALEVELPIEAREASVYWRWIGVLESDGSQTCPPAVELPEELEGSWSVGPLFDSALVNQFPDLARFCLWEYDGEDPLDPGDAALLCLDEMDGEEEHGDDRGPECEALFLDLEPDRMAVVPVTLSQSAAEEDAGPLEQALETHFLGQAGGDVDLPLLGAHAPVVRLTLLDTSPDQPSMEEEWSPHGRSLHQIARHLLCQHPSASPPNDKCVAQVHSRLAMSYLSSDPWDRRGSIRDLDRGGLSGLVSELAEAIVEAYDDWKMVKEDLWVLNLSLAWDRLYGGTEDQVDTMLPAVQAVFRALEAVTCKGAVVVAAAGNLRDLHPDNSATRPMLPAAWTSRSAPACSFGPSPVPLLWASGAFAGDWQPVSNALAEGMPSLAAFGDHATVLIDSSTATAKLTGSSVSTLVTAAAAAAVAYYDGSLAAPGVMATVRGAGDPIPPTVKTADFCAHDSQSPCPAIRYVSICEAARAACLGSPSCSLAGSFPQCPSREAAAFGLPPLPSQPPGQDASTFYPAPPDSCGEDQPWVSQTPGNPTICPRRQAHSASRRAGTQPQPEVGLCPSCVYVSDLQAGTSTFHGQVTLVQGEELVSPTLHLEGCDGSLSRSYRLADAFDNSQGNSPVVDLSLNNLPTGCQSVHLSYSLRNIAQPGGSTTVPILVGKH